MGVQQITKEVRLQKCVAGKVLPRKRPECSDWCGENGIKTTTFYDRQRKVARAVSHELAVQQRSSPSFEEYHPQSFSAEPMLTLHLPYGTVAIHKGADTSIIEHTLHTLNALC